MWESDALPLGTAANVKRWRRETRSDETFSPCLRRRRCMRRYTEIHADACFHESACDTAHAIPLQQNGLYCLADGRSTLGLRLAPPVPANSSLSRNPPPPPFGSHGRHQHRCVHAPAGREHLRTERAFITISSHVSVFVLFICLFCVTGCLSAPRLSTQPLYLSQFAAINLGRG